MPFGDSTGQSAATALPLRVQELLPEDGQQFGFDEVGCDLDISHIQLPKYLRAAEPADSPPIANFDARLSALQEDLAMRKAKNPGAVGVIPPP